MERVLFFLILLRYTLLARDFCLPASCFQSFLVGSTTVSGLRFTFSGMPEEVLNLLFSNFWPTFRECFKEYIMLLQALFLAPEKSMLLLEFSISDLLIIILGVKIVNSFPVCVSELKNQVFTSNMSNFSFLCVVYIWSVSFTDFIDWIFSNLSYPKLFKTKLPTYRSPPFA